VDTTPAPRTVASTVAAASAFTSVQPETHEHSSDRMIGTLVHRMLERFGFDETGVTRDGVLQLVRTEDVMPESTEFSAEHLSDAALNSYRALCGRREIRALYLSGERWHEVPFTMRRGGLIWRGTIDCLIRTAAGAITVLEFKTGRRRMAHEVQLELYRDAASRLFPGMTIEARLVYPGEPAAV
jgi:ATP-dependent exoDNAse (exonuclease V) beta subunit